MRYLLDTHTWIWWHTQSRTLSRKVFSLIANPDGYEELLLSAISFWEFCKLVEKDRIAVSSHPEEWMALAVKIPKLRVIPLSARIAFQSTALPESPFRDPGDQIIVATARDENATILTKDKAIRKYPHVRTLW